ncbi:response regulator transcription factor [Streptomyces sp. G45]|uniref:response regulator transcription factor n=1 Tax=Streptomyces sp. G45 TaxID=3406627 RepID=UPI003C275231
MPREHPPGEHAAGESPAGESAAGESPAEGHASAGCASGESPAGAHPPHGVDRLCAAGSAVYGRALRASRIRREEAAQAPCLVDFGLLHPDVEDLDWLLPTPPSTALPRLLRGIEDEVARQRAYEERLFRAFEPLLTLAAPDAAGAAAEPPPLTVLDGPARIDTALRQAMADAAREALAIRRQGPWAEEPLCRARPLEQDLLSRGGHVRTLHQHSSRHTQSALAYFEGLDGDIQARTLGEVTGHMLVLDRTVAFIPANDEHTVALEIRHPAIVDYLSVTFDRLWRLATPLFPNVPQLPAENGVTTRQRTIARLLAEGLTDAEIAKRLDMNLRTTRLHISKLASALGSNSRAQLGYLIGRSGLGTN